MKNSSGLRVSGLRDRSKRDSSTSPADSFAGANEKKRRRLASVPPAAGRRNDRWCGAGDVAATEVFWMTGDLS